MAAVVWKAFSWRNWQFPLEYQNPPISHSACQTRCRLRTGLLWCFLSVTSSMSIAHSMSMLPSLMILCDDVLLPLFLYSKESPLLPSSLQDSSEIYTVILCIFFLYFCKRIMSTCQEATQSVRAFSNIVFLSEVKFGAIFLILSSHDAFMTFSFCCHRDPLPGASSGR